MIRLILCLILVTSASADVRLPAILSDNMVLQREAPVRIFGKADPGERVTVRFRGQSVTAETGAQGRWELWLKPMNAGGPAEMSVQGSNTVLIRNVLVGEVWVASGQSNMVWPVRQSNDAGKESAAATFPQIRFFKVALKVSSSPLDDVSGQWIVCSPETAGEFSGVAYFFARDLHRHMKIPFGIIQSAWGGTPAEAWTSAEALNRNAALKPVFETWNKILDDYPAAQQRYEGALKDWEKERTLAVKNGNAPPRKPAAPPGPGHHHSPSGLFNAMIAPIVPYSIRGAIWYQGETNAVRAQGHVYKWLFETMIRDWRDRWGQGEFPFLFVQLANYGRANPNGHWPLVQEAQLKTLEMRNTGMAVAVDIGEADDIHPKNKQDVGRRLALAARHVTYGEPVLSSGPMFRQVTREGKALRLWFDSAGQALRAKGGGELRGFVVAGEDRRFHPAEAVIEGKTIVVHADAAGKPVAVRYGWANNPDCNLYNSGGLPASPFRSDSWNDAVMPEEAK